MYICHYCVEYNTESLSDLIKHFKRKTKCQSCTLHTYEDSYYLSKKKYVFNFDKSELTKNDYSFIITHFNDDINFINKNYRNEVYERIAKSESHNQNTNQNTKYYCFTCSTPFTRKFNLDRHIESEGACERMKIKKSKIEKNKEICQKMIDKEIQKIEAMNQQINYNHCNFQHINNQNNNSNTYHVNIRDFVHDRYDISHIKDKFYLEKDFFLYHNFLRMIMENKTNQNIFFSGNEAVVYTDKELNRMSSDKAGYLLLNKLSQSFDQLFQKQDLETQEYYAFIAKYYQITKGQYKHDTIFKDYDVNEKRFFYTSNSGLFRSRDKYLAKMISVLEPHNAETREMLKCNLHMISNIPIVNPNIEDYASIKMRYRDLKD